MRKSGIYGIRNIINGKWYIGSTSSTVGFKERWSLHRSQLNRGIHKNSHLQLSWNKYGEDIWEWNVLEECNDDMLTVREQSWINYYDSMNSKHGYNLREADRKGKFTKEHREKISKALSGKKKSAEHNEKNRLSHLGQICSIETRKKLSLAKMGNKNSLGHKHSEETKRKLSRILLGNTRKLGKINFNTIPNEK